MSRIARQRPCAEGLTLRGLNQLARELVLATASDWPFMISMGMTVAYAESRVRMHINRFNRLLGQIEEGTIDADWLSRIEACDNIFPYIDYHDFAGRHPRSIAPAPNCGDQARPGRCAGGT